MRKFIAMAFAALTLALAAPTAASASTLPQNPTAKVAVERGDSVSNCRCYVRYRYNYRVRYYRTRYTVRYHIRWRVYHI